MQNYFGANTTKAEKQKRKAVAATLPFEDLLRTELQNREIAIGYVNSFLAEEDEQGVLLALRDIADAAGIGTVAKNSGLNRESLYKMLSGRRDARLGTLLKLLKALGITLRAVDAQPPARKRPGGPPEFSATKPKAVLAPRRSHRVGSALSRAK